MSPCDTRGTPRGREFSIDRGIGPLAFIADDSLLVVDIARSASITDLSVPTRAAELRDWVRAALADRRDL